MVVPGRAGQTHMCQDAGHNHSMLAGCSCQPDHTGVALVNTHTNADLCLHHEQTLCTSTEGHARVARPRFAHVTTL